MAPQNCNRLKKFLIILSVRSVRSQFLSSPSTTRLHGGRAELLRTEIGGRRRRRASKLFLEFLSFCVTLVPMVGIFGPIFWTNFFLMNFLSFSHFLDVLSNSKLKKPSFILGIKNSCNQIELDQIKMNQP